MSRVVVSVAVAVLVLSGMLAVARASVAELAGPIAASSDGNTWG